jgi:hypothetical protein
VQDAAQEQAKADAEAKAAAEAAAAAKAAARAAAAASAPAPAVKRRSGFQDAIESLKKQARREALAKEQSKKRQLELDMRGTDRADASLGDAPVLSTGVKPSASSEDEEPDVIAPVSAEWDINPFLYKDPTIVSELVQFRDDPLRLMCIVKQNASIFLLLKDPTYTEKHAADSLRTVNAGQRKLFVFSVSSGRSPDQPDPRVIIPQVVAKVFSNAGLSREHWTPLRSQFQTKPSVLLRDRECLNEPSALGVALARALVGCIALEARERYHLYPFLGNIVTQQSSKDKQDDHKQRTLLRYDLNWPYNPEADYASMTSSFKHGYGPCCALLAAVTLHTAAAELNKRDFPDHLYEVSEKRRP